MYNFQDKRSKGKKQGSPFPPQIVSAFHGKGTIRYLAGSTIAGSVTVQDLLQLVVVTTSTTSNYELLD